MKRLAFSLLLLSACVTQEKPVIPVIAEAPVAGVSTAKIANSGKCLDISGASMADFAAVQVWSCNNTDAQKFRFQDYGDGWFSIQNVKSGKCLDASAGSAAPGTRFIQYTCSGAIGHNQHFRQGPNGTLIARHSNLCLDANNWGTADGTPIVQWHCGNAQANQSFTWSGGAVIDPNAGWRLVWSDEFNGAGDVDRSKWNYEVWRPRTVNNELQAYTDNRRENVRQENGRLIIEARRDWFQGNEYTSGRIKTQGKASWTYGKFEARVKLPVGGKGSWPAFWMMPDNQSRGWPACGEIDVMEWVSYDANRGHGTIHNGAYNWPKGTQKMGSANINPNEWNIFSIEWYPTHIEWFINGQSYHRFNNENRGDDYWAFDKPFHIILNYAFGGDWGAATGLEPQTLPKQYEVDYVRVYKR